MSRSSTLTLLSVLALLGASALVLSSCGDDAPVESGPKQDVEDTGSAEDDDGVEAPPEEPRPDEVRADRITTRHVLLGHAGSPLQGARVERTLEEAVALAEEIKSKIEGGASMKELVVAHSDDPDRGWNQGQRKIRNYGIPKGAEENERNRGDTPEYSDLAFTLEAGEVGILRLSLGIFVILREE